ncbi:putative Peptidylprolyl isomerase [Cocos nucifera]|nr:putative Peptidylprolyl isomerase [Cocos nucifera]
MMNEDAMDFADESPVLKVGEEKEIGKQGLKKKLVKEGDGWDTPEVGDEVEVHYTGTLLDGTKFDSSRDRGTPFKFKLGQVKLIGKLQDGTVFVKKGYDDEAPLEFKTDEEQVIEGLDRAVLTMKKGEVAYVTIPPEHAFGSTESKQDLAVVRPNSTVTFEVELASFVKEKDSWDMNNAEKIEAAGKKKEEGNALFKAGKYARASKRYEKGAKLIEYDSSFSDEEKKQSKVLKITCNLNNAACKLKLKDYKQAEKLCTKVLELDGRNVKALYRRAQAYIQLADLDLAEVDIKKALEIDPDNRDVKLEYRTLKEKVKEYNKKEAKFYGNMFAKMSKLENAEAHREHLQQHQLIDFGKCDDAMSALCAAYHCAFLNFPLKLEWLILIFILEPNFLSLIYHLMGVRGQPQCLESTGSI